MNEKKKQEKARILMEFADWITEKGYWPASKGKWFGADFLGTKTTAQIYELFNKRKEKS